MGHGTGDMTKAGGEREGTRGKEPGVPPSGPSNQADERQGTKRIEGADIRLG
jgi:hypothetical protein